MILNLQSLTLSIGCRYNLVKDSFEVEIDDDYYYYTGLMVFTYDDFSKRVSSGYRKCILLQSKLFFRLNIPPIRVFAVFIQDNFEQNVIFHHIN